MPEPSTFESVLLGVLGLLLVLWQGPGLKAMWQRSMEAEKDWPAVLWPLAAVAAFVALLIAMVRG